jgi:hypothetical protein
MGKTSCEHQLGLYGGIVLYKNNLEEVEGCLDKKILEFNTSNAAIPHPGWIVWFEFCPLCGKKNDRA